MCEMQNMTFFLAEESELRRFSVDSRGSRRYDVSCRAGGLKRERSGSWEQTWAERENLKKAAEAVGLVGKPPRIKPLPPPLDPGALLREQRQLLEELNRLDLPYWMVLVRSNRRLRWVRNRRGKDILIPFAHDSLLLRVRLEADGSEFELGEGKIPGGTFNRDGLLLRLRRVRENRASAMKEKLDGPVPVVLAAGDGGILWHELMGHSLEADHVCNGDSPLHPGLLGKQVMSDSITLSARETGDPFFPPAHRDDEGERCRDALLVEKGVLRHFISDTVHGERLGISDRGHARLQSFDTPTMPRMFAIYLRAGRHSPEEVIRSVDHGIYASEFGGGRVLFRKKRFFFHIPAAYRIENGCMGAPLGAVVVQGDLDTAFHSVSMVADDFQLDRGISFCHKKGQVLHVRVGQPTVRIDGLEVARGG